MGDDGKTGKKRRVSHTHNLQQAITADVSRVGKYIGLFMAHDNADGFGIVGEVGEELFDDRSAALAACASEIGAHLRMNKNLPAGDYMIARIECPVLIQSTFKVNMVRSRRKPGEEDVSAADTGQRSIDDVLESQEESDG